MWIDWNREVFCASRCSCWSLLGRGNEGPAGLWVGESFLSRVVQTHHIKRAIKMNIVMAVEYLCHLPSESTNVTKAKATKNEAILSNEKISC